MELTEEKQDNTSIIHLEGEMDYLSCDELKKTIDKSYSEIWPIIHYHYPR